MSAYNRQLDIYVPSENEERDIEPQTKTSWAWTVASSWLNYIGNGIGNTVSTAVTFGSYPKEHVEPHSLPKFRTDVCDYSGKSERVVFAQFLPYDSRYGIIHSMQMTETARRDCYDFCKKNGVYPISIDFIRQNGLTGPYFGTSGGVKNFTIVPKSTTLNVDGVTVILVSDGNSPSLTISLKTFCGMNKLDHKNILKLLDDELKIFYEISVYSEC